MASAFWIFFNFVLFCICSVSGVSGERQENWFFFRF
jgi:hypothetical protein